jgi:hypothetical protein
MTESTGFRVYPPGERPDAGIPDPDPREVLAATGRAEAAGWQRRPDQPDQVDEPSDLVESR